LLIRRQLRPAIGDDAAGSALAAKRATGKGDSPRDLTHGSATRCFPTLHLKPVNLGRELVEALPRRCEGERHRFESLGRTARGRGRRCQPSKVWGPSGDRFSDPAAIGLPSYAGSTMRFCCRSTSREVRQRNCALNPTTIAIVSGGTAPSIDLLQK